MARKTESLEDTLDHPGNPEELVREIFKRLHANPNIIVNLVAGKENSEAIISAVIKHTFDKFPIHAEVQCTINDLLTFAVIASAPGIYIKMSYWYGSPSAATYKGHKFTEFHAPRLIHGYIKNKVKNAVEQPEDATTKSLNHEGNVLGVRQNVTAEVTGISYSSRAQTTTTRIIRAR